MSIIKKPKTAIGIWLTTFILVLAIVATGTVSWFITNTEVSISSPSDENLAVQVNAGDLEVSVSYRTYQNLDNDPDWHYGKFTDYSPYSENFKISSLSPKFIDVTGSGNTLWFPETMNDDDPVYTNPNNWSEVTDSPEYCVTLKVKFRTSQTMDVYLDRKSYVSGVEDVISSAYVRSSSYGDFSADGICAAVRVAFLEVDEDYIYTGAKLESSTAIRSAALKYVWAPNDTYKLYSSATMLNTENSSANRESYLYYEKTTNGAMDYYEYDIDDYLDGNLVLGTSAFADGANNMVYTSKPLVSFVANGTVQEKEIIIRIWFEGTDREANIALDGGKIKYNFVFSGINKGEVSNTKQNIINGINFTNNNLYFDDNATLVENATGDNKVLYSLNGIDWSPVSVGTVAANFPDGEYYIYVRSIETLTEKVSAIRKVHVNKTSIFDE